jgi:hypothetical protein
LGKPFGFPNRGDDLVQPVDDGVATGCSKHPVVHGEEENTVGFAILQSFDGGYHFTERRRLSLGALMELKRSASTIGVQQFGEQRLSCLWQLKGVYQLNHSGRDSEFLSDEAISGYAKIQSGFGCVSCHLRRVMRHQTSIVLCFGE